MAKSTVTSADWKASLDKAVVTKKQLNALVMNYLVVEGFKDAADLFAKEANISHTSHIENIQARMEIRLAVQSGDIDLAIEKVNELNPEILDTNAKLFFMLQQQKLIELIRAGEMMRAIEFAQTELAPRAEESPEFLDDLERTMSLLIFSGQSNPSSDLIDLAHRQIVATELNAAILTSFSQDKDPKLPSMLKILKWAQEKLDEKVVFPKIRDLSTGEIEYVEMMDI